MKKIIAIILVCLIVLSGTSVLASMTCSYCGSGGREECQGDSIGTFTCTSCDNGTRNIATHHFQCYNSMCYANYYTGYHYCGCDNYLCTEVCTY